MDVYNRVSSFISTVYRDVKARHDFEISQNARGNKLKSRLADLNIVIVTHGLTLRLLLMRWFQFTVEEFEQIPNPRNADIVVLEPLDRSTVTSASQVHWRVVGEAAERMQLTHHSNDQHDYTSQWGSARLSAPPRRVGKPSGSDTAWPGLGTDTE